MPGFYAADRPLSIQIRKAVADGPFPAQGDGHDLTGSRLAIDPTDTPWLE